MGKDVGFRHAIWVAFCDDLKGGGAKIVLWLLSF